MCIRDSSSTASPEKEHSYSRCHSFLELHGSRGGSLRAAARQREAPQPRAAPLRLLPELADQEGQDRGARGDSVVGRQGALR
eukprot:496034-Alexandrium_andersonii.AAC.1